MSQNDMSIANQAFPAFRSDLNSALQALASLSSGATEPSTMYAYQLWADTTTGLLKIRNAANSAWITIGTLASVNLGLLALSGGSLTGALNTAKGSDIASASTTDIGAATGNVVDVTGTTTITSFGTAQAGAFRVVRFTGALTLTHNATSLILPTAANITTAAGDAGIFISLGSGNWYCAGFQRKSGEPLYSAGRLIGTQYFASPGTSTYTPTTGTNYVIVEVWGGGGSGGSPGSPGAGGGYCLKKITSAFSGVTVTVGAGGASATGAGGNGGGTSSFGSICSATGGGAGLSTGGGVLITGTTRVGASVGGSGTGGDINTSGGGGYGIWDGGASFAAIGGAPARGSGVGQVRTSTGSGSAGSNPGGGGLPGSNTSASGAGGSGLVIVWEYS